MKRKQYIITSNAGHKTIKHAWNSAIRETEAIALAVAREKGESFILAGSTNIMDGFEHTEGTRTWRGAVSNTEVVFGIRRVS
jgi:hypothetical protein